MQMHSLENADNVTKIEMFDIFEIHIKSRMSHLIGLIYVVRKHWYLITSPVVAQSNPPSSNLKQGVGVRRSGGELAIRQERRKEEGGTFICHLFSTNALFPRPWTLSSLTLWNQVQNYDYSTWQQVVLESWRLCPLRSVQNLPLIINIWFHVSVTQVRGAGGRSFQLIFQD